MSNILKKLQEQEGELEARLTTKPESEEPKETGESPEVVEAEAPSQENVEPEEIPVDDPATETTPEDQDDSAEKLAALDKRFRNYKASTDKTIYTLRQERKGILSDLAKALEEVESLKSKLEKSENTDFVMPFTEEDEKAVGPEAMEIFKKTLKAANESAVKPYLEQQKKEREQRIESVKQMASEPEESPLDRFARELELLEPDWKNYLNNPAFKEFLDKKDSRGLTWKKRWLAAEKAHTPELILEIFDAFNKPRKKLDGKISLDETGSPSNLKNSSDQEKKHWTPKDIAEFHKKQQSGYYRKSPELMKEARRIEQEIDAFVQAQYGG